MEIDTSTEFGSRVARHLADDLVVWLTTVGGNGTPQPSPVWFLWDGETALIFSQPNTPNLRNIAHAPRVSLNFNSTPSGGDVVIIAGDAAIASDSPRADGIPAYIEKYAAGLAEIGMSPAEFAQAYSVPIRVRPTSLRGH